MLFRRGLASGGCSTGDAEAGALDALTQPHLVRDRCALLCLLPPCLGPIVRALSFVQPKDLQMASDGSTAESGMAVMSSRFAGPHMSVFSAVDMAQRKRCRGALNSTCLGFFVGITTSLKGF